MEAQDFIISSPFFFGEMDIASFYELVGSDMFANGYPEKAVTLIESHELDFRQIDEFLNMSKEEYTIEQYKGFSYRVSTDDESFESTFVFYNDNCGMMSMNRKMFLAAFDAALSGKNIRKNSSMQEQKKTMNPAEVFAAVQDLGPLKKMVKAEDLRMLAGPESAYFSMNVRDQKKGLFSVFTENEKQAAMIKMFLGIAISPAAVDAAEQYLPPDSDEGLVDVFKSIRVN